MTADYKYAVNCEYVYNRSSFHTFSKLWQMRVHMTSSIAVSRLGMRPQRQAECRSSSTFATGSPGHTLCYTHKHEYELMVD